MKASTKKKYLNNPIDPDTSLFIEKRPKNKYNKIIDKIRKKKSEDKKITNKFLINSFFYISILISFYLFYLIFSKIKKNSNKINMNEILSYFYYYNETDEKIIFYYYNENEILNIFNNYNYTLKQNKINNNLINDLNNTKTRKIFTNKLYWGGETTIDIIKAKEEIKKYKDFKTTNYSNVDYYKRENPKISLIITVYNQENYLRKIYDCIQKQTLKDIEIIFVDDASKDNSSLIINEFMKEDKRIIYIKNEKNRRALYSRNKGILIARGEYILVVDPDDLLLNDILIKTYETAKKYDLDILQFYVIVGSEIKNYLWRQVKYKDGILYNSQVKNIFYHCITRNLWDKLIKREIYIKAINFMKLEFHKETYILHNDDTAFLGLISKANSYGFLEQIGYFYNLNNPKSTFHYYFDAKYMNDIFHSLFATMKYYYIQTDNNNTDKHLIAYNFFAFKIYKDYKNKIQNLTSGFDYIIDVLDLYLNCTYYNENQRSKLIEYKNKINERKNEINNNQL